MIFIIAVCIIYYDFIAARQAMDQGRSPIIIDNTNTQAWEMKPYVEAVNKAAYFLWKLTSFSVRKLNELISLILFLT